MVLAIDFLISLILIFILPTNHAFGRWKEHLFDILIFVHFKKIIMEPLAELPINTTSTLKFHAQLETNVKLHIIIKKIIVYQ